MVEFPQDLSLQDLRVIIHGLRMASFSSVDEDAAIQIQERIKSLPSPESLLKIDDNPKAIKHIVNEVGEIMRLVEIYGKRDPEYRARFKSKKGLPPRYKTVEWRKNMSTKANMIKSLVKISAKVDESGNYDLANKLLVCAKNIRDLNKDMSSFSDAENELRTSGLNEEADLVKEAALGDYWQSLKDNLNERKRKFLDPKLMHEAWRKVQALAKTQADIGNSINGLVQEFNGFFQQMWQPGQKQTMGEIIKRLQAFQKISQSSSINLDGIQKMVDNARKMTDINPGQQGGDQEAAAGQEQPAGQTAAVGQEQPAAQDQTAPTQDSVPPPNASTGSNFEQMSDEEFSKHYNSVNQESQRRKQKQQAAAPAAQAAQPSTAPAKGKNARLRPAKGYPAGTTSSIKNKWIRIA